MELFCTDAERECLKTAEKRSAHIFRIFAAAVPAVFILLCLLTNTGNAKTMHAVMILTTMALGGVSIAAYILGVKESRTQLAHLEMLCGGPAEDREGVLSLEDGTIQIPKSIRIRKVLLEGAVNYPGDKEHRRVGNTIRMYVRDYDMNAEKSSKDLSLVPEDERTEEESPVFSYDYTYGNQNLYITVFLMPWDPEEELPAGE